MDLAKAVSSTDSLALLGKHRKMFAQLFDEISLHDFVLIIRCSDFFEMELIIVLSSFTERIIRFYHEGPEGSHQAVKANSSKIIRRFTGPISNAT